MCNSIASESFVKVARLHDQVRIEVLGAYFETNTTKAGEYESVNPCSRYTTG